MPLFLYSLKVSRFPIKISALDEHGNTIPFDESRHNQNGTRKPKVIHRVENPDQQSFFVRWYRTLMGRNLNH